MKTFPRIFRSKIQIDTIKPGTFWILDDEYVMPISVSSNLLVYYETHEHWFDEIIIPSE